MTSLIKRFLGGFNLRGESSMTNYIARHHVKFFRYEQVEQIAATILSDKDHIPLSELAEQLAECLYRDELRYGGWAVDVGLLGSSAFVADALQEPRAGDGDLWKIVEADEEQ